VLDEHLRSVALALGDHADVEASVEQLGRRELSQRQDRSVEVFDLAGGRGRLPAQRRTDRQLGPALRAPEAATDLGEQHPALGSRTSLVGAPRCRWLAEQAQRLVFQLDGFRPLVRDTQMLLERGYPLRQVLGGHRPRAIRVEAEDETVGTDLDFARLGTLVHLLAVALQHCDRLGTRKISRFLRVLVVFTRLPAIAVSTRSRRRFTSSADRRIDTNSARRIPVTAPR
jgi:hypothetical protein